MTLDRTTDQVFSLDSTSKKTIAPEKMLCAATYIS